MSLAIDVAGLDKWFGPKHVVDHVAIKVETGHITGFLGPNGAGKTTTLRMLCGLLTPDAGEGEVLGLDFRRHAEALKRRTGYMTQRFSLYEDMTIAQNLMFFARVHGLDNPRKRVDDSLKQLGLEARRDQLAGALSGGWKQRLALAASTLHEPNLLLLDEPTAGVDPKARREFWDAIHELAGRGVTVLVSTHYMDEAERCHDIGYILGGKLIARGTAEAIIAASRLTTFEGSGDPKAADAAIQGLRDAPGVLTATAFGQTVHVSGPDKAMLEKALEPWRRPPFQWREVPPTLEDVFIKLMDAER